VPSREALEHKVARADAARRAFLRLWTAKEASCKATGTGIYGRLAAWRFAIGEDDPRGRRLERLSRMRVAIRELT